MFNNVLHLIYDEIIDFYLYYFYFSNTQKIGFKIVPFGVQQLHIQYSIYLIQLNI